MKVTIAKNRVQRAEEALAAANKELVLAQVETQSLEVLKSHKATTHPVWEICQLTDWSDESKALYNKVQDLEDEVASTLLGADERIKKLNALNPERWPLTGEYRVRAGDYPTDKDMSYAISTAIFDAGFGRGSQETFDGFDAATRESFKAFRRLAVETCGDAGEQGFQLWFEGRHDT